MEKQLDFLKDASTAEESKPQRGVHRNRKAGHGYELYEKNAFNEIGFVHLVTSRSESRSRDAQKIDLINKDEHTNGRFPYNIQCKNVSRHLKYHDLYTEIPKTKGVINVILHKFTSNKGNSSGHFIPQGYYAIISREDFLLIVKERLELEELRKLTQIPTISRQEQQY